MFVRLFTILNIKNETIINWFQILNQFEHEKLFTTVFIENWGGEGRGGNRFRKGNFNEFKRRHVGKIIVIVCLFTYC